MAKEKPVNIFDTELDQLKEWKGGEPLSAKKLNAPVKAINDLIGTARRGQQVIRQSSAPAAKPSEGTTRFVVDDPKVQINHLRCRVSQDRNSAIVLVALPPELVYDDWRYGRDGVDFSITPGQGDHRFQVRTARLGTGDPERQRLVPWYNKDDWILAAKPDNGTGVFLTAVGNNPPVELRWVDLNGAGRVWAEVFST